MKKSRKRLAVLFGGRSTEHEISVISALQVMEAVDEELLQTIPVYVAQGGRWYSGERLFDKQFYRNLPASLREVQEVVLLPTPGVGGLVVLGDQREGTLSSGVRKVIEVDVFFPCFHGTFGEDGCMQGLLELADVAYTGSGVLSSAVGMDKYLCKCIVEKHGIPVLPGCLVGRDEFRKGVRQTRRRVMAALDGGFPLFVKPCSLGSSVGVNRVDDEGGLDAALLQVFEVDLFALVEPCISDPLEINVSVLDDETQRVSVTEIPVVASGGVLTYEEKYMRGGGGRKGSSLAEGMAGLSRIVDPSDLPEALKASACDFAGRVFSVLRCGGVARIDFICDSARDAIYFNEINTLPGSLSYYLWAKSRPPLFFTEMINVMVARAEEWKKVQLELSRDFGFRSLSRS
jgi:D-alanine-D-alanine ligase